MEYYHTLEFMVADDEIDYSGRLFLDRLIDKLQIANYISAKKIGFTDELFEEKNVSWMLLNNQIKFYKDMVKSGQKIIIQTAATGIKGVKFFREDFVYIEEIKQENLLAHNGSVWILADIDSHMPKRPKQIINKEEIERRSDLTKDFAKEIEGLKPISEKSKKFKAFDYLVSYSDIDSNRHMHNTHYIKMAIDAIASLKNLNVEKEEIFIEDLNIRYLREIFLNEKIRLFVKKNAEYYIVEGTTDKNEVSFIVKIKLRISEIKNI